MSLIEALHPDDDSDHREQPTIAGRKTDPRPQVDAVSQVSTPPISAETVRRNKAAFAAKQAAEPADNSMPKGVERAVKSAGRVY